MAFVRYNSPKIQPRQYRRCDLGSNDVVRYAISNATLDEDCIGILGRRNKGKTYAAKGLVERLLSKGRQVVVLDPTGAWWGLKASPSGKRAGKHIWVFGGAHQDFPIAGWAPLVARNIVRLIVERRLSVILDFEGMYFEDMQAFGAVFLRELYKQHDKNEAIWVVVDEGDVWAPQRPTSPPAHEVLKETDRMVRHGRIRGFRTIMICQRAAKLNKDVLTQVEALACLALSGPDRKAARDWLEGFSGDVLEAYRTLPGLPRGEAWIWTPERQALFRDTFPPITTYDSSQSPKARTRRVTGTAITTRERAELLAAFRALSGEAGDGKSSRRVRGRRPKKITAAGRAIRQLRHETRYTQGELAKLIGSTQSSIGRIEAGHVEAGTHTLERIAKALKRELVIEFRERHDADEPPL